MQINNFDESKERYEISALSLYNSKNKLYFYDNTWKEQLNTLKPTGLLTLLMSRNNRGIFKSILINSMCGS